MLAAESAGPAASQLAEDADLDRERRSVVLRGVWPLPGEVPGAGWGAPNLLQSRRHGHSWQRPYDDAGEELRPDRRRDGEMGPQVDRGVDRRAADSKMNRGRSHANHQKADAPHRLA